MSITREISKWLLDPRAEDVRQLAKSLRSAMGGAQEIGKRMPQVEEVLFKHAAKPFSEYAGYDASWDPSRGNS